MAKRMFENGGLLPMAIGLAMALGPLTALSLGSRHAGYEAWERAYAGVDASQPGNPYADYDSTAVVPDYARGKTLMDIAEGAGLFDRFESAVKSASLDDMLSGEAAYTVFLPMNDAFARLPADRQAAVFQDPQLLRDLVESHVVPGRISATDLLHMDKVTTVNGKTLALGKREHPMVGDAEVVKTEIAENGVVHIVDAVL
jgi:uncharacterized surface protein with fasciclin (FAS1) repeats